MKCIALPWDLLLLRSLKGIFHFYPFLPLSTPSQCCTLPTVLIPTLSPQWASSVLILWELEWGWRGGTIKLSLCAMPDSSRGCPSLCPGLTLRSDHWPTSSVWFSEPHHDSLSEKKHSWSLKIYLWIEMWQKVGYGLFRWRLLHFWRVHWSVCTLQKSIRKGDIFVFRSQLPQFLIHQRSRMNNLLLTKSRSLLLHQINTQLEIVSVVCMK